MENEKIKISIDNFDDGNIIVYIEKGKKNVCLSFGLYEFMDEMDYWGMPTKMSEVNGRYGFVFSKDIEIELIKAEIDRFIYCHKLEERDLTL